MPRRPDQQQQPRREGAHRHPRDGEALEDIRIDRDQLDRALDDEVDQGARPSIGRSVRRATPAAPRSTAPRRATRRRSKNPWSRTAAGARRRTERMRGRRRARTKSARENAGTGNRGRRLLRRCRPGRRGRAGAGSQPSRRPMSRPQARRRAERRPRSTTANHGPQRCPPRRPAQTQSKGRAPGAPPGDHRLEHDGGKQHDSADRKPRLAAKTGERLRGLVEHQPEREEGEDYGGKWRRPSHGIVKPSWSRRTIRFEFRGALCKQRVRRLWDPRRTSRSVSGNANQ